MYPFRDDDFAPRNGWYVAAFNRDVGEPLVSLWILNEPIVLYRKANGDPVAVNGRCPHRHFPLGKGRRVGDTIVCGYHGIAFGADGACMHIPSQDHVPSAYRLRTYPVAEHGIWLFIWPGDPAKADPALLPDLSEADYFAEGFRIEPIATLDVAGRYQLLNDNLLDLTHLAYLHGSSIGIEENASVPEVRDERGNMLRSRRHMRSVPMMPAFRDAAGYDGPVDRVAGMDFHLPGFHSGLDEMTIPADHPTRAGEKLTRRRVFHAVTPGKLHTTTYFFALGGWMNDAEFDRSRRYLPSVLAEDAMATEEIEQILSALTYTPDELMIRSDTNAVRGRRALQMMMDQERDGRPKAT
jgi:vanillate O-demethylase monooxygenase subunit